MFLIDFFLKKDNAGKRTPTPLGFGVLVILVFSGYHLSHSNASNDDKEGAVTTEEIIDKHEIDMAKPRLTSQKSGLLDMDVTPKETLGSNLRLRKANASPIVVFDDTKNSISDMVVPYGSLVDCILIHNIVTNNFSAPVIAQVMNDFYFCGDLLLPQGARIYGTSAPDRERDRVMVKFHTIVFQDGTTFKIKAIGLDEDGSAGLSGIVITDRNKQIIISMVTNFLSAFSLGLQDTFTNQVTGGQNVDTSARNAMLEGVGNTFEKEADRIREDVMSSKGYAIVTAGTRVQVYFEDELDVKVF